MSKLFKITQSSVLGSIPSISSFLNSIVISLLLLASCLCLGGENNSSLTKASGPALSLAKHYRGNINLEHYWISEKFDGVRAYWDGQKLISRGGFTITTPPWFIEDFPSQPLDGELWIGRGKFQQTVSTVRKKKPLNLEWEKVSYQVFDLPKSPFKFNKRLSQLKDIFYQNNQRRADVGKTISLITHWRVSNERELMSLLDSLVKKGAEGLMLRRGDSYHRAGRNNDLLKLKPVYDDEARVIAYAHGLGKHRGRMGSIVVQWKNGIQFHIGTGFTDEQRKAPPAIGSTITFKYFGLTDKGIPRHASFLRVRSDNNW